MSEVSRGDRLTEARRISTVFLAFAFAYFLSTLVRAITATLSPTLTAEFALQSSQLGLLAGGYFLGFALTQLPMGTWLDLHGPKRVIVCFLSVAVGGCVLFSVATDFWVLLAARVLTGVGVSACLMAPLTGYRRWFDAGLQLRSNSWMLMVGSFGLVASTLPVHWLVPLVGWRPLFWALAAGLVLSMLLIAWIAPVWNQDHDPGLAAPPPGGDPAFRTATDTGYAAVWRDPFFRKLVPIGFFSSGGFIAMLTLWVVPWLVRVAGYSAGEAADALFGISLALLFVYWLWGACNPWLSRRGVASSTLIAWGLPLSLVALGAIIVLGDQAGVVAWGVFLASSTVFSLAQPAVALALPATLAGRALSAFNLVVFLGVFVVQWGIGLLIDFFGRLGLDPEDAFRGALGALLGCCLLSYAYFLWAPPHNRPTALRPA